MNTAKQKRRWLRYTLISLTFSVIGAPLMASEPEKQKSFGYSSPDEAWNAFRLAQHDGRWREAYECLTPDYQDRYTQGMLFTTAYLQGTAEKDTAEKLKAILRRHGLTLEELDGGTDHHTDGVAIYNRLKDKEGFYGEAMTALRQVMPCPTKGGVRIVELGALTKIEVVGDKATGCFVKQLGDQSGFSIGNVRQTEMGAAESFRRINGRWFVGGG